MIQNEIFFSLFEHVKRIKGNTFALLVNLLNGTSESIPAPLDDVLIKLEHNSIEHVLFNFPLKIKDSIGSFLTNLVENQFAYYTSTFHRKKQIPLSFNLPDLITNVIVNFNSESRINMKIFKEIGCEGAIIVVENDQNFFCALDFVSTIAFEYLCIFVDESTLIGKKFNLGGINKNLKEIVIFNSKMCIQDIEPNEVKVTQIKTHWLDQVNLPLKSRDSFNVNRRLFNETYKYNPYFYGKMFINKTGEISPAPGVHLTFGNIENVTSRNDLIKIISNPEFFKFSLIHKGICLICQSCEYRRICVDSRIPIPSQNGIWRFETECNYNPYIGKWSGEEGYLNLSACGISLTKGELKLDNKRLKRIRRAIWGF